MIEGLRQFFGAAAISLVQPNNVEPRNESLFGTAEHVTGFARPFKAVKQNQSRVSLWIFLPMTFSANLRAWLNFEQARNAFVQTREFARPEIRRDGHEVRIAKCFVRDEFLHSSHRRGSEVAMQATHRELGDVRTPRYRAAGHPKPFFKSGCGRG